MRNTGMTRSLLVAVWCAVAVSSAACSKDKQEENIEQVEQAAQAETAGADDQAADETSDEPEATAEGRGGAPSEASAAAEGSVAPQGSAAEEAHKAAAPSPESQKPAAPDKGKPAPPKAEEPKKDEITYTGDKPCRAKSFDFSSVRNACNTGGFNKARNLMKSLVKRAKDADKEIDGKPIKCSSCHDNTKTYTKKPNAVSEMRKLL